MVAAVRQEAPRKVAVKTELAEKSLRHFVRQAWPLVEPGRDLVPGFYIDAICDHLQAVYDGDITRLVITLPPGFLKSTLTSVLFPSWIWIDRPSFRFLTASHDSDLALRDAVRSRRVIVSDWYQERWGDRFAMTTDQNVKSRYENDKTGHRISLGTGSGITGKRGDLIICDDPHDAEDAYSTVALESTVRWWNETVPSRLNDPKHGAKIVIQQRIHVNDLAGAVIDQGYEHLNLPMEYDPAHVSPVTSIGWKDPRTEPGEVLDPERYGPAEIAEKKRELGSRSYGAQYQQQPISDEGGMFKRHWWRFWQPRGTNLPPVPVTQKDGSTAYIEAVEQPPWWERTAQSWDMTFKETQSGSYVAALIGATYGANGYILPDHFHERTDFPGTVAALREMSGRHPDIAAKLIEEKANGAAVMDTVRNEISGVIAVQTDGSKEARASASTARTEAGNWHLPHPAIAPWVWEFIDELAAFPTGRHDDYVDSFSQLDRYLFGSIGDYSELDAYMARQLGGGRR